ncbi:tail fiber domain-containing protein [Streptomyces sp. NPDC012623]|uniref:tail fiber domain-containing protein n=1 Tax=unclassified Streptomyces TaxID=2593676 RepID=UPI003687E48F
MRFFHRRSRAADHTARAGTVAPAVAVTSTVPVAPAAPAGAVTSTVPVAPAAPAVAVNGHAILETVAALPVSTWRYLWEPEDVRHLGPMAQDWHAAFGLNQDDTTIPVVDGLGVSLVCIQALHRRVEELTAEVERLREAGGAGPNTTGAA